MKFGDFTSMWVLLHPRQRWMNTHNKFYVQINRKFGYSVKTKEGKQVRTHQKFYWENSLCIKKQLAVRTSVVPVHKLQLGYIVLVWVLILKNRPVWPEAIPQPSISTQYQYQSLVGDLRWYQVYIYMYICFALYTNNPNIKVLTCHTPRYKLALDLNANAF
jgi:hypothetical protein